MAAVIQYNLVPPPLFIKFAILKLSDLIIQIFPRPVLLVLNVMVFDATKCIYSA